MRLRTPSRPPPSPVRVGGAKEGTKDAETRRWAQDTDCTRRRRLEVSGYGFETNCSFLKWDGCWKMRISRSEFIQPHVESASAEQGSKGFVATSLHHMVERCAG